MNFYLLQLVGKWISLVIISVTSFFGVEAGNDYTVVNEKASTPAIVEVIDHDVERVYNSSLVAGVTNVLVEGRDGLFFIDSTGNRIVLQEPINKKIEVGTARKGVYNGIITAYGPDCVGCNGRGFVACRTRDKSSFNLINDGIYYNDTVYGEIRVLSAALSKFPCGTVIHVRNSNQGDFMGIVLDTGGSMRRALENGIYHFDKAFETERDPQLRRVTNKTGNVIFEVQRWGW